MELLISNDSEFHLHQDIESPHGEFSLFLLTLVTLSLPLHSSQLLEYKIDEKEVSEANRNPIFPHLRSAAGPETLHPYLLPNALHHFVLHILSARSGSNKGWIRSFFLRGRQLVLNIGGDRWCEKIQKPHQSNHIQIVLDAQTFRWHQFCLDPECRIDFKPSTQKIPSPYSDVLYLYFETKC